MYTEEDMARQFAAGLESAAIIIQSMKHQVPANKTYIATEKYVAEIMETADRLKNWKKDAI